jgi:hypothetical protein
LASAVCGLELCLSGKLFFGGLGHGLGHSLLFGFKCVGVFLESFGQFEVLIVEGLVLSFEHFPVLLDFENQVQLLLDSSCLR